METQTYNRTDAPGTLLYCVNPISKVIVMMEVYDRNKDDNGDNDENRNKHNKQNTYILQIAFNHIVTMSSAFLIRALFLYFQKVYYL